MLNASQLPTTFDGKTAYYTIETNNGEGYGLFYDMKTKAWTGETQTYDEKLGDWVSSPIPAPTATSIAARFMLHTPTP